MPGQQQDDERISGAVARLQPWQFVAIAIACVLAVASIPVFRRLALPEKKHEATSAIGPGVASGEQWHPPIFPALEVEKVTAKPVPPATQTAPPASPPPIAQVQAPRTAVANSGPADLRMFGQRGAVPPQPVAAQSAGDGAQRVGGNIKSNDPDGIGGLLRPSQLSGFQATRIPHPWATIEQGRVIACNGVTAMTSQLPGFVKAKVTYDVLSADGTTTLIDRNSDIFGEIQRGLIDGQDRVFVLWRQITTPPPELVRITLNSPGADELGEAGLSGDVNHHVWQRIGAALLLSGVDTMLQGASIGLAAALAHGGTNGNQLNFYSLQGTGQSLASSLLQNQVHIPDTLHRDQGLPCSIFVAGDLDFSSVYALKLRSTQ